MDYYIDQQSLRSLIEEEVSRVAASAFGEGGQPLYDAIRLTSADDAQIERLERDAIDAFVKRTVDICTPVRGTFRQDGSDTLIEVLPNLSFNVPDFDENFTSMVEDEITRYIVMNVCSAWFQERYTPKVEEYAARGQVAMDKAVSLLKTIKSPRR